MTDARGPGPRAALLAVLAALAAAGAAGQSTEALEEELTPQYLEGEWCSTESRNGARTRYLFAPDGSFRYGPEEYRFELIAEGELADLRERLRGVLAVEEESFRAYYTPTWRVTFERGPCG